MTREQFFDNASVGGFDACWWWKGKINSRGYGFITINRRVIRAHRAAYELLREPVPSGLVLHHTCEEKSCVNPKHLVAITIAQHNAIHGKHSRARQAEVANTATHCKRGHEWTPENTYINPSTGTRNCRACIRLHAKRAYDRKRMAEIEESG